MFWLNNLYVENGWCLTAGMSFRMFFMVLIIHHTSFSFEATENIPNSSYSNSVLSRLIHKMLKISNQKSVETDVKLSQITTLK